MKKTSEEKPQEQVGVNLNLDQTPILYTDNVIMVANEDGVTFNIGQKVLNSNQVRIVARIGMSRTQAKKFITEAGRLMAMSEGHLQTGVQNKTD